MSQFIITHHAVRRYLERIEPELTYQQAKVKLTILLNQAKELKPPRLWAYVARREFLEGCDYLFHPDATPKRAVVFAIRLETGYRVVTTVLPPDRAVRERINHGARSNGSKYRGRQGIRMDGGYKRKKLRPEDWDSGD